MRDRPWGQTLGALGLRGLTGQLTLHADDKDYAIAFEDGGVIGAWSPNASDSAPRVALTNHLCASTAVAQMVRRIAAQPDRDEVDIVREMARLSPDQVSLLREKLVAQRAARTFSVEDGAFTVDDDITIPTMPGPALDIRSVVYFGARLNLSETQLGYGLRHFGSYFTLKRDAVDVLDRFGFTDAERTVLVELRAGTSLPELEAAHRDMDPRMVQAVVYALFACGACEISEPPLVPRAPTVQVPGAKPRAPSAPPVPAGYARPDPGTTPPVAYTRPESALYGPFVARTSTQDRSNNARTPRADSEGIDLPDPRSLPADEPFELDLDEALEGLEPEPVPVPEPTPALPIRPAQKLDLRNPRWSEAPPMRDPRAPRPSQPPIVETHRATQPPLDLKNPRPATEGMDMELDLPDPRSLTQPPPLARRAVTDNPFPPVGQGTPNRTAENPFSRSQGTPAGRSPTLNPFPVHSPTPGPDFPTRTPTPGPEFPMRTPSLPVRGRVTTEYPTPPQTGRTNTENPFPVRSPTPPAMGRTSTEHPFPMRSPTPPAEARTESGSRARPVNGPDEAGVPRNRGPNVTQPPRPQGPSSSPVDPLIAPTAPPAPPRPGGAPPAVGRTPSEPPPSRTPTVPPRARPTSPVVSRTSTARKTAALIAARWILFEQGADHFTLLGVAFDAPVEAVRIAYLNLVRQLHPDKLAELAVDDAAGNAQKLFAAMGQAFTVLTDAAKRQEYVASLTGDAPAGPRTKTGEEVSPAIEAYRRGELALRRDQPHEAFEHFQKANELEPNNVDFLAMLGWAQFCASTDKLKAATDSRKHLERATQRSQKPLIARFFLGRMDRMLGRDREALRHFQIVLEEQPSHAEAKAEVRAIEARLASAPPPKKR